MFGGLLFWLGWSLAEAGPPAPVARGSQGVVASAHPDASRAGVEILERGGNAVDAAVAVAYALSVVEPYSAGVGGGGFLLYYDSRSKKASVLDYREVAPRRAHRDMYLKDGQVVPGLSQDGILAVAVPGMVPGLAEAQRKLGKLTLAQVLDPAIRLAEKGFLVDARFHEGSVYRLDALRAHPEAARVFLANGEPIPVGQRLKQPALARTLRNLKREGPRLFTHGAVARAMAAESKKLGGALDLLDLQRFKPRWREPLIGSYRGHRIITMPPPSSGGTHLLQMLAMLELDREKRGRKDDGGIDDLHMLAEIMRRAYADRAVFMGDPAFVKIPLDGLLSSNYLAERYASIDPLKATPSDVVTAGAPNGHKGPVMVESDETTHLTVIDAAGNVVSLTQTVNTGFGSAVVVPGTGVLLNNEMDDFAAAPGVPNAFGLVGGEANSVQPGKIPLSSMTPTIVEKDGRVRLAVGAPGGPTIITTVLQIIVNVIDRQMTVAQAVAAPRVHLQWLPDELRYQEGGLAPEVVQAMVARGHRMTKRGPWGNATAIEVLPDGTRVGASDPRGVGGGDAQ